MEENKWGTKEWFDEKAGHGTRRPENYFSHNINGYQRCRHNWIESVIAKALQDRAIWRIVEIGCGRGDLLERIRHCFNNAEAIGLDFVENLIGPAREKYPACCFQYAVLPCMPLEDRSADLVIASEVLYYLSYDEQVETVANCYRVLRPGGHIVLTSAIGRSYLATNEMVQLLEKAGFEIMSVSSFYAKLYQWIALIPTGLSVLDGYIDEGVVPSSSHNKKLYKLATKILRVPGARAALSAAASLSRVFLRSSRVPRVCELIGRLFGIYAKNGNIVIAERLSS